MKRILLIVAVILLVLGSVAWYQHEQSLMADNWIDYQSSVGKKSEELEKKKSSILREMAELESLYSERMSGNAFLQILCSEPRVEIYKEVYPVLNEQNMTGILAVSVDAMPGDKGYMSIKQAKKLLAVGWELCLKYDASYGDVSLWYEAIAARMDDLGFDLPKNVYFEKSKFQEDMIPQLEANELTHYFHRETSFGFYEPVNKNNPYWQINAIPWNMSGVKNELYTAIENGGDLIFVVGFSNEREEYKEEYFSSMLNTIKDNEKSGKLILASFDEVEERRAEAATKYAAWLNEMLTEKNRLEQELADVKAELKALY